MRLAYCLLTTFALVACKAGNAPSDGASPTATSWASCQAEKANHKGSWFPKKCTAMACGDWGFDVQIESLDPWLTGNYVMLVGIDGNLVRCEGSYECGKDTIRCGDSRVRISNGDCQPSRNVRAALHVNDHAAHTVTLDIEREGEKIFSSSYHPSWRLVEVNGPGCEPGCCQAREVSRLGPR